MLFEESDDCLSPHVAQPCGTPFAIDWFREQPRTERVRVRAHTCACQPVFYELCQAGGVRFIRRTTVRRGRMKAMESPRAHAVVVDHLWELLLTGRAR
ncbi:hypothetical protein [Nonomuraea indica]|uniref:hypothetical protein n=1 Tax=Nonomuraea indica TaxID=1581193 RepID=UPI000C7A6A23|nr:hypothetical protein [Nonomuraea indica]